MGSAWTWLCCHLLAQHRADRHRAAHPEPGMKDGGSGGSGHRFGAAARGAQRHLPGAGCEPPGAGLEPATLRTVPPPLFY